MTLARPHPSHAIWMVPQWLGLRVTAPAVQKEPRSLGRTGPSRAVTAECRGEDGAPAQQLHWHFQDSALLVHHCHVLRLAGTMPAGMLMTGREWGVDKWKRGTMVPRGKAKAQIWRKDFTTSISSLSWSPLSVWATLHAVHFSCQDTVFGGPLGKGKNVLKGQNEKYPKQAIQFSHSVVSDSLRSHGLQKARPPCPSPTPGVYSNSCPSSRWCHPAISSSVVPLSSRPQSFPVSGSFPVSQFST